MKPDFAFLAESAGIHFLTTDNPEFQAEGVARSYKLAMDAQPGLVTVSNAGIPAFLTQFFDPKYIEVIVGPMKAAEILGGELKKGDWLTDTATFALMEYTGETSAYGDWNENGSVGANPNFPSRQSFHYQTMAQWGQREMERAGLARIDWANAINIAAQLVLNKYQNKTYFFGVAGLQNYGLLNDPNLYASIAPISQSGRILWSAKTGLEIYADLLALYGQLITQSGNSGIFDMSDVMTLAMSPKLEVNLAKTNDYNVNLRTLLKTNFPNLKIVTAPEYSTDSGELVQWIVNDLEGQRTAEPAFTVKLMAHPIVVGHSNFSQKKSQGTWGTIIYRPFLVASMIGC